MHNLPALIRGHPRRTDAGLATALATTNTVVAGVAGTGVIGWLCILAVHVPLIWRRSHPAAAFWAVSAMALLSFQQLGIDGPYVLFVPLLALYSLARHRPRWHSVLAAGIAETLLLWTWLWSDTPWPKIIGLAAITAATVLLGTTLRNRRAYLDQLEERARHLEHERDQRARLAAATERERIAREMHDIVAHNLAVMVTLADGAALTATDDPKRAATVMQKVAQSGRQALDEMQHLLDLLRTGTTDPSGDRTPQPGLADIDELVDQVRAAGPRVTVTREGRPGNWNAGAGLAVYRVVQEALTNTLKHAGPQADIHLRLRYLPSGVDLEITDDGAGRLGPTDRAHSGHGLVGMAERAGAYRGHLEAGPRPGTGWRVTARMTFDEAT